MMLRTNPIYSYLIAAALSLGGLWLLLPGRIAPAGRDSVAKRLTLYCAAGMRRPIELICQQYLQECGVAVDIQYGGSNTLLSTIEIARKGDLYLAADDEYMDLARQKGLVGEQLPIAHMRAVVVVPRGNRANIRSFRDLLAARLSLANPDQAAIGKATRHALAELGKWDALETHTRARGVFKPTVLDVMTDVEIGSADAGIVWDAVARQSTQVEVVPLVELQQATADISIGVVTHASAAASALHFARFVAASDRGLRVFADYYYQPVEGDVWQHSPQLVLYAGTENRHVLEPILQSFSQREGIAIATRYDDDRNLQTEIQNLSNTPAGHTFPDIYIPGHSTHFERCQPLFRRCHILSTAPLVIITPRGNSNNIHNLSDLAKPGLRIALGDPDRSTLGTLTLTLLESSGIYTDIVNNNPTIMATSSQLVSAIAAQSADAAVVLEPEARAAADRLHIVPIDSPRAEATQLFAVAEGSNHHQLAQRLLDTIGQSRAAYEHAGFRWKLVETSL